LATRLGLNGKILAIPSEVSIHIHSVFKNTSPKKKCQKKLYGTNKIVTLRGETW